MSESVVSQYVRPIAICVFWRGGDILVAEGYDTVKGSAFYRPLGGTIEFGELGTRTVEREIMEEIGQEVSNVRYLATIENVFTYVGRPGHEIVLVYRADFAHPDIYERDSVEAIEGEYTFTALWKPMSDFAAGRSRLVPEELYEMIQGDRETR